MKAQLSLRIPPSPKFVASAAEKLSPRESQVITLLADGETWKSTAATLGISPRTVRAYVESIRRKLNVPNTPAAVAALCR
ncbi:MAG TPA: helix-turn-helix domain-containing protein [Candidatus Paceibacterota bacterium]|nr:helix-turn-helix domain-containing protein [Candidatus Paceibacterota bacterium]